MAGMNDIKARIKSVEGTMQITKAMELVATSKLRRAKETVERTRPFYQVLGSAIDNIISLADESSELCWFNKNNSKKTLFIVFAGDRGLAGGYNSNIFKLVERLSVNKEAVWLPIGKKAVEYAKHRNYNILQIPFLTYFYKILKNHLNLKNKIKKFHYNSCCCDLSSTPSFFISFTICFLFNKSL
jgi:F-type H+-transporting ATPase subunit gamma